METSPGQRLRQWRDFKKLTLAQVSDASGVRTTTLSTAEQPGASNPSYDTITKVLAAYPDLSPDWLLLGTGPMLRDGRTLTPMPAHFEEARPVTLSISHPTPEEYRQLQEENRRLREQLANKEGALTAVEGEVTWLRSQVGGKAEASADAADEDEPRPPMMAVRNHEYVEAPAVEQKPYVAAGFVWGR